MLSSCRFIWRTHRAELSGRNATRTASSIVVHDATSLSESDRERAWDDFIRSTREPKIATPIRDSWLRSRDVFHIDPALKRSPTALTARRIGVSRMTLHRKIGKWSISRLEVLKAASRDPIT